MEKLKAAGLFGGELVSLTGALARRYNECLAMMGISPTALSSFSVDAMGWSPEIAIEKKMPGLMALREEYGDSQPLAGARIAG